MWGASGHGVVRIDPASGRWERIAVPSLFDLEGIAAGGGAAWATSSADGLVWRIVPGPIRHVSSIPVGYGVSTIAYGAGAVWVGNRFDDTIVRIDPQTLKVTRVATVPAPQDIAISGDHVFVAAGAPSGRSGPVVSSACSPPSGPGKLIVVSDLPLQGAGSAAGLSAVRAIRSLLERAGYRAGRYRLAYQSCDDATAAAGGYDDGQCLANAGSYADDASVVAVIGTYNSTCASDEIPLANRAPQGPLAMISPFDTGPFLTRGAIGDAGRTQSAIYGAGRRNFFRTIAADHIQVTADAVFAKRLGVRRVAVVYNQQGMLQQRTGEWFAQAARRLGLEAVPLIWSGGQQALARALRRVDPDATFIASAVVQPGAPGTDPRATALTLGRVLPGRPVIVTDFFAGPSAVAASHARFYGSYALPRVAAAVRVLVEAIARSNGSRRSVVAALATHFDPWGRPRHRPRGDRPVANGAERVAVISPPSSLVPTG